MTANEGINLVTQYCKTHGELTVKQAIDTLRPKLSALTSNARWQLIVVGITRVVSQKLTGQQLSRGLAVVQDNDDAIARETPPPILLSVFYEGANGLRKALIEFTIADFICFKKARLQEAAGLKKRIDAADCAIAAMTKQHVKTVGELSAEAQREIEILFEEALARAA